MITLIDEIVLYLVAYEQLLVTVLLSTFTALSVIFSILYIDCIILYYMKQELKRKIEYNNNKEISEVRINKSAETTAQHDVIPQPISTNSSREKQSIVTVDTPTTKTIQSEYDLELFMIRLYKNGVAVTRLKEGLEKSRGISLNRLGEICMHKVVSSSTWKPTRGSPFVRFPLARLIGCFHAEGTSMPSFIMDFKVKTWHLAVGSSSEVNYIVRGFKLMGEKLRTDDEFLSSVTTLLSKQTSLPSQHPSTYTPSKQEYKVLTASPPSRKGSTNTAAALLFPQTSGNDDDDDALSVSTINTNIRNH